MTLGVILVDSQRANVLYQQPVRRIGSMDGRHGEAVVGQTIDDLIDVSLMVGVAGEREVQTSTGRPVASSS